MSSEPPTLIASEVCARVLCEVCADQKQHGVIKTELRRQTKLGGIEKTVAQIDTEIRALRRKRAASLQRLNDFNSAILDFVALKLRQIELH